MEKSIHFSMISSHHLNLIESVQYRSADDECYRLPDITVEGHQSMPSSSICYIFRNIQSEAK